MDDLISRDAAKKIVSLMVCAPSVKILVEHSIDDLPAVDAVPVEWLKGLMLSTEDDVDKEEFAWIMREWQEEQEENNGQQ